MLECLLVLLATLKVATEPSFRSKTEDGRWRGIEYPGAPGCPPDAPGSGSRVLPRSGLAGAGSAPDPALLLLRAVLSTLGF